MPKFSEKSLSRLSTAHPDLQKLFREVIRHFDCTVLEGRRTVERQRELVAVGRSKTMNSKHLPDPETGLSNAVDVIAWPVNWGDTARHYYFGGFVRGVAAVLGIPIRWGGDWDSDTQVRDQSFNDLVHFELDT